MIEQITANDFVDVKDIKGMFLYTKSNKIFSYLRIYPFNLDLLTTEDRRNLTNRLAAAFDAIAKILCIVHCHESLIWMGTRFF